MARVIVIDNDGNVRMSRNTDEPLLTPPPGWDEARWTAKLVEDLLRQLDKDAVTPK